jgi:hypothetical protein
MDKKDTKILAVIIFVLLITSVPLYLLFAVINGWNPREWGAPWDGLYITIVVFFWFMSIPILSMSDKKF